MAIKNIIFDIGNVLLKWDPKSVVKEIFNNPSNLDQLTEDFFHSQDWHDLNLGKLSIFELIEIYHSKYGIEKNILFNLMDKIEDSLIPLAGSFELLDKLHKVNIPLYSITDNVIEFIEHFKTKYDFWPKFIDVIVSAEVGFLKPNPEIYQILLNKHNLKAEECLFLDDYLPNIEGAQKIGMQAYQFSTALECENYLINKLGIII